MRNSQRLRSPHRDVHRGHIPTKYVGPLFRPSHVHASEWAKIKEKEHLLEK